MIRYKVVKLCFDVACSCYAGGKYGLKYRKNTIVTAKKGTLGIAVFERKYQAEKFIKEEFSPPCRYRIIHVSTIGRGKRYCCVCHAQDEKNLDNFYSEHSKNLSALLKANVLEYYGPLMQSPRGTIYYQQVKVLE